MGQVPKVTENAKADYLIVGDGRLARHFAHYFDLLHVSYVQWSRRKDPQYALLQSYLSQSKKVLLLISDAAIAGFVQEHIPADANQRLIHCSGCLTVPGVYGAHPLMTFGPDVYSLAEYQQIPFMVDDADIAFNTLFPALVNPHYIILPEEKPLYHAMCVLGGNYMTLLWQKCISVFASRWQIPATALHPYMQRMVKNIIQDPKKALTGPLMRGDWQTVNKNLQALAGDPYHDVYAAFVKAYQDEHATVSEEEDYV